MIYSSSNVIQYCSFYLPSSEEPLRNYIRGNRSIHPINRYWTKSCSALEFNHMMNRSFRFLVLLLFALLQCVAPIAHAHVNGDNVDQNVHITISESTWSLDNDADITHFSVESPHSSVICIPPENRCDEPALAQDPSINVQHALVLPEHSASKVALPEPGYCGSSPPYRHPYGQAPPA